MACQVSIWIGGRFLLRSSSTCFSSKSLLPEDGHGLGELLGGRGLESVLRNGTAQAKRFGYAVPMVWKDIHLADTWHSGRKPRRRFQRGAIIVHSRDQRDAEPNAGVDFSQCSQIRQDLAVRSPRMPEMCRLIYQFQIIQKQIREGSHCQQILCAHHSTGVYSRVQSCGAAGSQGLDKEGWLQQRLTTGKSHATAGFFIEDTISQSDLQDLGRAHLPSDHLPRRGWAHLYASTTPGAVCGWGGHPFVAWLFTSRADSQTFATAHAPVLKEHRFPLRRNAFRIVTPGAIERTTLQEDGRSNTRPIVHRVSLDVEYQTTRHTSRSISLT
jgi:hypothetical protein